MRALAVALAAALLAVPAAGAKTLTKLVAVGAGGTSVEVRGINWTSLNTTPTSGTLGEGFVLLYPLMERGVPAMPGRFYPDPGVACFSWDRSELGACGQIGDEVATRVAGLPVLKGEPTVLRTITVDGAAGRVRSNGAVAIELAFNRPQLSRRLSKRPRNCIAFRATWAGMQAAARPTRFWSCAGGLWSRGRIYPVAPLGTI